MKSIFSIEDFIKTLGDEEKRFIFSMFDIQGYKTNMRIPGTFEQKVLKYILGNTSSEKNRSKVDKTLDRIRNQKILKVINKWTYESAFYNYLRAFRPGVNIQDVEKLQNWVKTYIEDTKTGCDFCKPEKYTPEDSFGRIYGKYCVTAANLAKFDKFHSLLILKKHNPLDFTKEEFFDYVDTALKWFLKVRNISPEYRYPLLLWNCLPRAGASQIHGHMQLLAAKSIYPRMKLIIEPAKRYSMKLGMNYFDSLYKIHDILGLSVRKKHIRILYYLTPIKEREIFIISERIDDLFKNILYKVLKKYINELQILSFNLSLYGLPVSKQENYLYILRLVDRGNLLSKTSDIASMELYASSVIANDPVQLKKIFADM